MTGTHGDLFCEIGQLVVAANAGQALDLDATSEELSQRYANLNVPPDAMARAIARSLGAVGISVALLRKRQAHSTERPEGHALAKSGDEGSSASGPDDGTSGKSLFPSGVRLALLS